MTINSPPGESPMVLWVVRNGNRGSVPAKGKKSSHRTEVAPRMPTSESMNTTGMPGEASARRRRSPAGPAERRSTLSRPKQTTHRIAASTTPAGDADQRSDASDAGSGEDRTRSSDREAMYRYWMTMNTYPTGIDRIAVHIGARIAGLIDATDSCEST